MLNEICFLILQFEEILCLQLQKNAKCTLKYWKQQYGDCSGSSPGPAVMGAFVQLSEGRQQCAVGCQTKIAEPRSDGMSHS